MSTHNIGFYEDLTKIIFELSNIIKYAPYFFCWRRDEKIPTFCFIENKGAGNRTADQCLCFHYIDRTIPLLP